MKNWLVAHAHEHIWCHPYNDQLYLVEPRRLSATHGEMFGMMVTEYSIRLPKKLTWFHVFQLGNIDPEALGIALDNRWRNLSDLVNATGTLFKLYNEVGRTLPLGYAWLRQLPNRNVIIAVEMVEQQADFSHDQLFISVYGGFYRQTNSYDVQFNATVKGDIVRNPADRFAMVQYYQQQRMLSGHTAAYINGHYTDSLKETDITLWDYVEVVRDGTVRAAHYFNVNELRTFHSQLDGRRKYLLHLPKQITDIHFSNDLELYVLNNNTGRIYHQHRADSLRQVTHNDYAISVARVMDYIHQLDDWHNLDDLDILVLVRHSGLERPLTHEAHRIRELYKLSDEQIVEALVGMNAQVPEWQAATLERSAYNRIMAARYTTITNELATEAYGYNAVSRYAGDTPQRPELLGGVLQVKLSPLLAKVCTVYEYDVQGRLLGYYNHTSDVSDYYVCANDDTALVEVIQGEGGQTLDIREGADSTVLDRANNYRFYLNKLSSGTPTQVYEDVTGSDAYTLLDDGTLSWSVDLTRRLPTVVSDLKFLTYGFEADLRNGLIRFTVTHLVTPTLAMPMPFVPETVELWMNGHALIQDIDYHIEWPEIIVYNKTYLEDGNMQYRPWIDVRCRGLADTIRKAETGFVVNGLLSNNTEYDLRDDKVVRVTVGGGVFHRDNLQFREDHLVGIDSNLNGLPYSVDDPTVPLRGLVSADTYQYRDVSRELDKRVAEYMSNYYPTPPGIEHNPIAKKHCVFSPILNAVIRQMINGWLVPVQDSETHYISTMQFDAIMADYHELLKFDPLFNGFNPEYTDIHPYDGMDYLELSPLQYSIVERINHRYLNNKVVLNKLLKIKVNQHG
jgi:hypothetical protein